MLDLSLQMLLLLICWLENYHGHSEQSTTTGLWCCDSFCRHFEILGKGLVLLENIQVWQVIFSPWFCRQCLSRIWAYNSQLHLGLYRALELVLSLPSSRFLA